jgi:hypothetical protein
MRRKMKNREKRESLKAKLKRKIHLAKRRKSEKLAAK